MEDNKPLYFAIDSDVLRTLSFIDLIMQKEPSYDLRRSQSALLQKYSGYFFKALQQDVKR